MRLYSPLYACQNSPRGTYLVSKGTTLHSLARTAKYIPSPSLLRPEYPCSIIKVVAMSRQSVASLLLAYSVQADSLQLRNPRLERDLGRHDEPTCGPWPETEEGGAVVAERLDGCLVVCELLCSGLLTHLVRDGGKCSNVS